MVAKVKVISSKKEMKVLDSTFKEVKSEKGKDDSSKLEQEVSEEEGIESMSVGNLDPTLKTDTSRLNLETDIPIVSTNDRIKGEDTDSQRIGYTGQDSHANLEAKYGLNSAESQRTQNSAVLGQSSVQQNSRMRFDNPDLLALRNRGQEQGEHYEGRIDIGDVSVKRRKEWER